MCDIVCCLLPDVRCDMSFVCCVLFLFLWVVASCYLLFTVCRLLCGLLVVVHWKCFCLVVVCCLLVVVCSCALACLVVCCCLLRVVRCVRFVVRCVLCVVIDRS